MSKKNAALFAGIGGIELGLHEAGYSTDYFCEILPEARVILESRFPKAQITADIREMLDLPDVDMVTAGFPCQDLSIAGQKKGITGDRSFLIDYLFALLQEKKAQHRPDWLVIENVPYMLSLGKGEAMNYIVKNIERLGYNWAYRVIDCRSLGVPQRRPRVIFLASKVEHPKHYLFNDICYSKPWDDALIPLSEDSWYGFYWTEGRIGIGWAHEAVPPIKAGSTIGIPSPPAIWIPKENFFGTPLIEDAEQLQGFPAGWTSVIELNGYKASKRWKLVGNAVCVNLSKWLGTQLSNKGQFDKDLIMGDKKAKWPKAAISSKAGPKVVNATPWINCTNPVLLKNYINNPLKPLSLRAITGFSKRANESTLIKYDPRFIASLNTYTQGITHD